MDPDAHEVGAQSRTRRRGRRRVGRIAPARAHPRAFALRQRDPLDVHSRGGESLSPRRGLFARRDGHATRSHRDPRALVCCWSDWWGGIALFSTDNRIRAATPSQPPVAACFAAAQLSKWRSTKGWRQSLSGASDEGSGFEALNHLRNTVGVATAKLADEFEDGDSSMGRGDRKTTRAKIAKRELRQVDATEETAMADAKSDRSQGSTQVCKQSAPPRRPAQAATKSSAPAKKPPPGTAQAAAKKLRVEVKQEGEH